MLSKKILLFIPLFFLLVGGLLYYFLPVILYRPRIDSISPTDYVAPWIRPNTPLSMLKVASSLWDVHVVMSGALRLNMTFRIATRNGTRVIPSTIYLGHDLDYLYVGGEFRGMFTNPLNEPEMKYPDFLDLFFDVANDGKLTFPEAGSRISSLLYDDTWQTSGWYRDRLWSYVIQFGRESWIFADA